MGCSGRPCFERSERALIAVPKPYPYETVHSDFTNPIAGEIKLVNTSGATASSVVEVGLVALEIVAIGFTHDDGDGPSTFRDDEIVGSLTDFGEGRNASDEAGPKEMAMPATTMDGRDLMLPYLCLRLQ